MMKLLTEKQARNHGRYFQAHGFICGVDADGQALKFYSIADAFEWLYKADGRKLVNADIDVFKAREIAMLKRIANSTDMPQELRDEAVERL